MYLTLNLLLSLLLVSASVMAIGSAYAQELPPVDIAEKKQPNMDSRLADMYEEASAGGGAVPSSNGTGSEDLRVQVILVMASADVAVPQNLGIKVETNYENLVQATVPVRNLESIASHDAVLMIRMPSHPHHSFHVTSEGADLIGADVANASGYTGKGVKVAVIDGGFDIYDHEIAGNIAGYEPFYFGYGIGGDDSKHGTASAEIIVDVAPDVQLYLYTVYTDVEFLNLVDHIIDRGDIDIVSMSMSWAWNAEPTDGTSAMSEKINEARDAGILWVNAAGNHANSHWQGQFSDPDGDGWHNFSGRDETINVEVGAWETLRVALNWDLWSQDYELCLYEGYFAHRLIFCSYNTQNGINPPREYIEYMFFYDTTAHIKIKKYSATRNVNFHLFSTHPLDQYAVARSSIPIPADATGSLSVGAVDWKTRQLKSYSSQGPTLDGRIKPDVSGPTCVSSAIYDGDYCGTSAAAPHVAGAAALLLQKYPDASPDSIQQMLESNTSNYHSKSNRDGTGLVDVYKLLEFPLSKATVKHAAITGPDTIIMGFSEAVTLTTSSLTNFTDFVLTGGTDITPGDARDIVGISGSGTDVAVLKVAGPDMPSDATGRIDISGVKDLTDAELAPLDNYAVADRQAPTVLSATISSHNTISVKFSEAVALTVASFTDFLLAGESNPRFLSGISGSGTDTIVITVAGGAMPSDATGRIDVSNVSDAAGTKLAPLDNYSVTDGQIPSVLSATITGTNTVTIAFSEAVVLTPDNFADFTLTGGTGVYPGSARNITSVNGSGTDVAVITVAGTGLPSDATGRIDINGVSDAAGLKLAPLDNYLVADSQTDVPAIATPGPEPLLSGVVYRDANSNGIRDANERAIADATVLTVDLSDFTKVIRVTTDSSGLYEFADLAPGGYLVQVESHAGPHAYAYLTISDTTVKDLGVA